MSELAKLRAQLEAAEKAAAEAWEEWKAAGPQTQDAFLKRYNDVQGGVESLRQQISCHGASNSPVHSLGLFFVCRLAAAAAAFFRLAGLGLGVAPEMVLCKVLVVYEQRCTVPDT